MKASLTKEQFLIIAAFAAIYFIWGSTYVVIKIGIAQFPPLLFSGTRFTLTGIILLIYALIKGHSLPSNKKDLIHHASVGVLLLFGGNGLLAYGVQWLDSGIASLLIACVPLFMALIEFFVLKNDKLHFMGWLGLFIGFFGVALLVIPGSDSTSINALGFMVVILAAFLWACGSVYSKTFVYSGSMVGGVTVQMLAGGIALLIFGVSQGDLSKLSVDSGSLLAILYLIVFGSLIGYFSYLFLLQKCSAARVGTYAYVNPPIAIILGNLILKEPITADIIFSGLVILLGVLLVQASKYKKHF